MDIPPRIAERVARDFERTRRPEVLRLIASLAITTGTSEGAERIGGAILIVAGGDIDRLVEAAAIAEADWRDVLVAAGLQHDDWRARLDEALERP